MSLVSHQSNSEYWSQKRIQSGSIHSIKLDVYAVKQSALDLSFNSPQHRQGKKYYALASSPFTTHQNQYDTQNQQSEGPLCGGGEWVEWPHFFRRLMRCRHRYLKEVDCSSGQFKSAKLKDEEYAIHAPFFFTTLQKKEKIDAPNF